MTTTTTSTEFGQDHLENIITYSRDAYRTYRDGGYSIESNRSEFIKAMKNLKRVSHRYYLGQTDQDTFDTAVQIGFKFGAIDNDVMVAIIGGRNDALKELRK